MSKLLSSLLISLSLIAFFGCESSSSVTASSPEEVEDQNSDEVAEAEENVEASSEVAEVVTSSANAEEAEQKYRLASQLLEFAGPIEDVSSESRNVRWLAADLLHTAIDMDPTQFKYYRDLFMTYMVLQEPIRAFDAIEPATMTPILAEEVAEFESLVFGALEFASLIDSES